MILALLACAPSLPWAATVVRADGADDSPFGDPSLAANGARGGGCCAGSFDVYSIDPSLGRSDLVLLFDEPVVDGPGDDIVVFENPFDISSGGGRFMDPIVVEVSADGIDYATFAHDYLAPDPLLWSDLPEHWVGFGGITPVWLHEEDNPVDPFDRAAAGGDGFDLADLAPSAASDRIGEDGVSFVRLLPASLVVDPRTEAFYPEDPVSNGPDVDAVYGRSSSQ